jgi:hypothetical protein
MYSRNDANSVCDKLYIGPNGGCALSYNSIAQSHRRCFSNMLAFFFSNTSLKLQYCVGISYIPFSIEESIGIA